MRSAIFRRLSAGVVLSLSAVLSTPAATYHLDPGAGRNDQPGTAAQPWGSLESVLAARKPLASGDTLLLRSGYHGRPTITGLNTGDEIAIRTGEGQTPHVGSLAFKGAARWSVAGLTITPEGAPEPKRRPAALVTIAADCREITVRACRIYSVNDIAGWSEADWLARAVTGITSGGPQCMIADNTLRNVRFGITVGRTGVQSTVARNTIENFMSDGLRGLADHCTFEGNTVKNCFRVDGNHDDGFQSFSGGGGGADAVGVGRGVVRGVVLRGNVFISYTDPAQPFKAAMQGIGCFDGMFEDWVVEDNVVVTDMWHGIAFYGAKNCRIVNNTVAKNPIDAAARTPWIQVSPHKRKMPSTGNVVRGNVTPKLNVPPDTGTVEQNLESADYAANFVDPARFDFRLRADGPAAKAGAGARLP